MSSDEERRKKEIFEGMSPKRQQKILKKGYDKWDPFLKPKEPPFFDEESRKRSQLAAECFARFLDHLREGKDPEDLPPPEYVQGSREVCFGLLKDRSDKYQGMYDFCEWYRGISEEEFPSDS